MVKAQYYIVKFIFQLTLIVYFTFSCAATTGVVRIVDRENIPVEGACAIVSRNDSIIGVLYTNEEGKIDLSSDTILPINIFIQSVGFKNVNIGISNWPKSDCDIVLDRDENTTLEELVVEADPVNTLNAYQMGRDFSCQKVLLQ